MLHTDPAPTSRAPARSLFTGADGRSLALPFALVTSLFLLWGFCNGMIDVMDRHFQEELHLSLGQSAWVQFAHYLGYFLTALPAGWVATKIGYKGGIVVGLLLVAVGGFWFIPATHIASFWAFLLGVCVIAAGLTFLETVANPYTTVLGPPEYAASRINLAQSTNGIGLIFGPVAGGLFFYGRDAAGHHTGAATLWVPYTAVAIIVLVLALVFTVSQLPEIKPAPSAAKDAEHDHIDGALWHHRHFSFAVAAQFFYVAAQAGIFSFFINYMITEPPPIPAAWHTARTADWFATNAHGVLALTDRGAAYLASFAFFCFLAGRFSGAAILKRCHADRVLATYGVLNALACLLVVLRLGWVSVAAVFCSYFLMSIMFPTIFALGIHGLGARTKRASAYIVMAIMGGAILPKLMGATADHYGLARAFVVPMACFAFVGWYGLRWARWTGETSSVSVRLQGH